jgi:prepilin signal peptidase PulO-like enzyme (type II secretory pathway)
MKLSGRSLYHVPVVGWLAKDAIHGHSDAKYYFVLNMLAVFAALIYAFGYPFLISVALVGAASALTFLILLTASDAFKPRSATAGVEMDARSGRRKQRGASGRTRSL